MGKPRPPGATERPCRARTGTRCPWGALPPPPLRVRPPRPAALPLPPPLARWLALRRSDEWPLRHPRVVLGRTAPAAPRYSPAERRCPALRARPFPWARGTAVRTAASPPWGHSAGWSPGPAPLTGGVPGAASASGRARGAPGGPAHVTSSARRWGEHRTKTRLSAARQASTSHGLARFPQ